MRDTSLDDNEREAMRVLRAIAGAAIALAVLLLAGASGWKALLMTERTATAMIASASGMRWWLPPLYIASAALMLPLIAFELWYVSAAIVRRPIAAIRPPQFLDARTLAAVGLYAFALLDTLQVAVTWSLDQDALHSYYLFEATMAVGCSLLIGSWVNWLSASQPARRRWPLVVWVATCALATQAAAERITGPRDDLADLDFRRLGIIAALAAFGALAKTLHEQVDPTRPRVPVVRPTLIRAVLAGALGAAWYCIAAILHNRGMIMFTSLEVALGAFALGASYSYVIGWLAKTRDGVAGRLQSWIVGRVPDGAKPAEPAPEALTIGSAAPKVDIDISRVDAGPTTKPGRFDNTDSMLLGMPRER